MAVKPVPDGYHTITPYLTVRDAAHAIEFYKAAFGATERGVAKGPDGKVMHAELMIGDSIIMLADEFPEFGLLSPQSIGGSGSGLHIYLDGVDAAFDAHVLVLLIVDLAASDQPQDLLRFRGHGALRAARIRRLRTIDDPRPALDARHHLFVRLGRRLRAGAR